MPNALLVIDYNSQGGKTHSYTFAVKEVVGGTGSGPIDPTFWANLQGAAFAGGDMSTTDPASATPANALLPCLLRFLRGIHHPVVTFTRAYMSDGVTPGPATGSYAVATFALAGTWGYNIGGVNGGLAVAPSTITLLASKSPALMNVRPGRNYFRYCVYDNWVTYGGDDGVTFDDATYQANVRTMFRDALTNSGLRNFLDGEATGRGLMYFGQAQFYNKQEVTADANLKNALKAVQVIRDWSVKDAQSRQVKKGRKEKVTAAKAEAYFNSLGVSVDMSDVYQAEADRANAGSDTMRPAYDDTIDDPDNFLPFADPEPVLTGPEGERPPNEIIIGEPIG